MTDLRTRVHDRNEDERVIALLHASAHSMATAASDEEAATGTLRAVCLAAGSPLGFAHVFDHDGRLRTWIVAQDDLGSVDCTPDREATCSVPRLSRVRRILRARRVAVVAGALTDPRRPDTSCDADQLGVPVTAGATEVGALEVLVPPSTLLSNAMLAAIADVGVLLGRAIERLRLQGRSVERTTPAARTVRVLCIEDQRTFSDALRIAVSAQEDIVCVGNVGTMAAGLELLTEQEVDVVLLNVDLPDIDGIEGTRRVKALRPETRVVILTGRSDLTVFVRAVAAGADGFLAKDSPFEAVVAELRRRDDDGMQLDEDTIEALRLQVGERGSLLGSSWDPRLTDREREVLALLAAGVDPQAIARQLGIRVHTSRGYVRNVLTKLGAHSQLEAVAVARRAGLLDAS